MSSYLKKALKVCEQRQKSYGHPRNNFDMIAKMWSAYLGAEVTPQDVALLFVLAKVCRERNSHSDDNLIDIAGYVHCHDLL